MGEHGLSWENMDNMENMDDMENINQVTFMATLEKTITYALGDNYHRSVLAD